MDESQTILIIVGALTVMLAVITGSICAVSFVRLSILEKMDEDEKKKNAKKLLTLLDDHSDQILSALSFMRLTTSFLIGGLLFYLYAPQLKTLKPEPFYHVGGVFVVILIFTEIIPRYFAHLLPEQAALALYPFLSFVSFFAIPSSSLSAKVMAPLTSRLSPNGDENSRITEDEILRIVEEGHEQGVLEESEKKMIHSIIDFTDTIAREVMVPRVDVIGIEKGSTLADAIKVMTESGYSRLPVYDETIDQILGIVYVKDFMNNIVKGDLDIPVIDVARKPPFYIPESKPVGDLLREMQKGSISIAVVVDEYGGTDGIITIEDILEEIVGEITDEYDQEDPDIQELDENEWKIQGGTILEDVNEELDLKISVDEHETIGGFVYGILGTIPKGGEVLNLEELGIDITVGDVQQQRIHDVTIQKHPQTDKED